MRLLTLFLIAFISICFWELICGKSVGQAVIEETKDTKKEEKDKSNENGIKDKTKKENVAKENTGQKREATTKENIGQKREATTKENIEQKREATTKDAQKVKEKKDSVKVDDKNNAQPKKVVKQHSPGQKYKKEWNVHDTL